jgi:hypothetical protein
MATVGPTISMTVLTKLAIRPLVGRTLVLMLMVMDGQTSTMRLMQTPPNGRIQMVMATVITPLAQHPMTASTKPVPQQWTELAALTPMKTAILIPMVSGPLKMGLMRLLMIQPNGLISMKMAMATTGLTAHGPTATLRGLVSSTAMRMAKTLAQQRQELHGKQAWLAVLMQMAMVGTTLWMLSRKNQLSTLTPMAMAMVTIKLVSRQTLVLNRLALQRSTAMVASIPMETSALTLTSTGCLRKVATPSPLNRPNGPTKIWMATGTTLLV